MGKLFDFELVFTSIPELLQKLPITLELALLAMVLGLLLGLLMAVIKQKKIRVLTQIVNFLISLIRGTPVIVQLYIAFFGIPMFFKYLNQQFGTDFAVAEIPGFVYAVVALGLNQSAFCAEIIRSALQSVDEGQIEAAHALGMSFFQTLRRVILPEAFEVALPTLGNSLISMIKSTSLAFTCAVVEITAQGKIIGGRSYRYFEVYVSLAIIYWVITIVIEQGIRLIEKKIRIPEQVELVVVRTDSGGGDKSAGVLRQAKAVAARKEGT
ncbi:MAG: amino acid ABC transporter permease [Roseburia sp.]|nr:amino acid ABC transporter permease [Roseburia sp.]